jgi:hypothetical protein
MSDGGGDRGPSVVGDGGLAVAAGRSGERDAIGESEEGMLLLRGVMIASARPGRPLMAPEEVGDQPAADGGLSSLSLDRAREKGFRFVFDVVAAGNEVPLQLACPARRRSTADVSTHGVHRGRLTPGPHVPYMYMFETHLGCLRTKCFREYKFVYASAGEASATASTTTGTPTVWVWGLDTHACEYAIHREHGGHLIFVVADGYY